MLTRHSTCVGSAPPDRHAWRAVRIASELSEALHAAYEQGVIHHDIKPANVLLSKGSSVRSGPLPKNSAQLGGTLR